MGLGNVLDFDYDFVLIDKNMDRFLTAHFQWRWISIKGYNAATGLIRPFSDRNAFVQLRKRGFIFILVGTYQFSHLLEVSFMNDVDITMGFLFDGEVKSEGFCLSLIDC